MGDNVRVGVLMGSRNDWETMKRAVDVLESFGIGCEARVLSAHRTPGLAAEYADAAESRGLVAIIAGAGMAAHLAGALAGRTTVPILGVPLSSDPLRGMDALLATVQMPKGIPVATFAIGGAGATNAALFAVAMIATTDPEMRRKLAAYRAKQIEDVVQNPDPRSDG
ncbi:MAG: 5-(carboxyamino)imidazole ribonucleotide mutase [Phycisphaerales bacterium]|nr:5-(carboxyamino)imidazole ribonucleotide mutase [Phycisphaerales bacterium]